MTLAEFKAKYLERMADFEKYWTDNQQKDPAEFPTEMNEADWQEQIELF